MDTRAVTATLASLPGPYFGGALYDEHEVEGASRVIRAKSPFRYYGDKCGFEADKFEAEAAAYFGVAYAHAVNSGTGALSVALHALNIGPGDEVIIPGYLWISDILAVVSRGAIPVLCEVDDTLNMSPADCARKMTAKTKCVIVIHMNGGLADIAAIKTICDCRNVPILEDLSQCTGGSIQGKPVGGFGAIAITSLQFNKMITCGEGGLVLTNDRELLCRVTAKSDLGYPRVNGIAQDSGDLSNVCCGEGRRFGEIPAAVAREQLKKLPAMLSHMRKNLAVIRKQVHKRPWFSWRRSVDPSGEPGSILALIVDTVERRREFTAAAKNLFPNNELRMSVPGETGLHVYSNCTLLTERLPVLPNGFPWNLAENAGNTRDYHHGALPVTDDLLERSIAFVLSPCAHTPHVLAVVEALNAIINKVDATIRPEQGLVDREKMEAVCA